MKKLPFPMFSVTLRIYSRDEVKGFLKQTKLDANEIQGAVAMQFENAIWVGVKEESACYHEALHFVEWLIEDRLECRFQTLDDSKELRAYLLEYVGAAVRRYILG